MSKNFNNIKNGVWNGIMYIFIYPVRNVFYFMVGIINMLAPRRSTQSIIIIAIMFYCLAYFGAKYGNNIAPSGLSTDGNFVKSLPCLGLDNDRGCHAMQVIIFASILMFPLLFWNQDYFFGSVDCIDYDATMTQMSDMMKKIKSARLDDKIEQKLDKDNIFDDKERRRIKRSIVQQNNENDNNKDNVV